jgi:transposase-like protein
MVARHFTDKERKKIIADYIECGSYSAVAKKYKVAASTIKRICDGDPQTQKNATIQKQRNTMDVLAYMESKKDLACEFIGKALTAMANDEKLAGANVNQIANALKTIAELWIPSGNQIEEKRADNNLFETLKESAKHDV